MWTARSEHTIHSYCNVMSSRYSLTYWKAYSPFPPSWNGFDFKPISQNNYHLLKPIIKPIILVTIIGIETVLHWREWNIINVKYVA